LIPTNPPTLSFPYTSALLTEFVIVPLNEPTNDPIPPLSTGALVSASHPILTPDSTVQSFIVTVFAPDA